MTELERLRAENARLTQAMNLWPAVLASFQEASEAMTESLGGFIEGLADSPELQLRAADAVAPIAMRMATLLELLAERLATPQVH